MDTSAADGDRTQEEFLAFKAQLEKVQSLMNEYSVKVVDRTLCSADLVIMQNEITVMTQLECKVTAEKMKSNYVPYKTLSLKMIQESYRLCDWLVENQCKEMDNVFNINSYIDLILEACDGKEDPLSHMNILFSNVMKNTNYFDLNFFGNLKIEENDELVSTQSKKQFRKSIKRPLEEQVVPVEVENETTDNELKKTLIRVKKSLKQAIKQNQGKPISYYKFAIDPFSLTYTIENIFHLASLAKDQHIKIETVSDDKQNDLATITLLKPDTKMVGSKKDDIISSLCVMNYDIWKDYITKYNVTQRMIEQDE